MLLFMLHENHPFAFFFTPFFLSTCLACYIGFLLQQLGVEKHCSPVLNFDSTQMKFNSVILNFNSVLLNFKSLLVSLHFLPPLLKKTLSCIESTAIDHFLRCWVVSFRISSWLLVLPCHSRKTPFSSDPRCFCALIRRHADGGWSLCA